MNRYQRLICLCTIVLGLRATASAADRPWFEVAARDFAHTVTAPARLVDYPLHVGAVAAIGALMVFELDRTVDDRYAKSNSGGLFHGPGIMGDIGDFYDKIGTSVFILSSAGAVAAGGLLAKRSDVVRTAVIGLEAVLFTKIHTGFLKRTFSRARPFVGKGPRDFDPFSYRSPRPKQSMPSGHTSSIFAFVTVLTQRHPSWWVRIPAFILAACVAVQRVESRNHWVSDAFFGAALGYGVGRTVAARHRITGRAGTGLQSSLSPNGLGFSYNF